MNNTVVNLQDNRAVFRIFVALLRFSFDSPSYNQQQQHVDARTIEGAASLATLNL